MLKYLEVKQSGKDFFGECLSRMTRVGDAPISITTAGF
jgi:hypothetical protein